MFNATTGEWEADAGADRTLGSEHGDANSTCHAEASAYGVGNNALGVGNDAKQAALAAAQKADQANADLANMSKRVAYLEDKTLPHHKKKRHHRAAAPEQKPNNS